MTTNRFAEIKHRFISTNGIRLHVAEAGRGPLVVMCHGFPESWYSWRHQIVALADAGYHAVAPDMRGYSQSDRPEDVDQYSMLHLTGDIVGLLDALDATTAVIVGHDWGAPVAWHCALFRPDRFRGVVGLSVPFRPRSTSRPTTVMPQNEKGVFYQLYFQSPGIAEAELEKDPRLTLHSILWAESADCRSKMTASQRADSSMVPKSGGFLTTRVPPVELPGWLTETDLDFYASEFERSGFRGGLNWYRNIGRNWELLAPWAGPLVNVPALYVAGKQDLVLSFNGADKQIATLSQFVPQLRDVLLLDDCGHWTQQERPAEVNSALLDFLKGLN